MAGKSVIYGEMYAVKPKFCGVAGHIRGALLQYRGKKPDQVVLHFETNDEPYQLTFDIGNAMYLLNILAEIEVDHGLRQTNRANRNLLDGRLKRVGFSNKPNTKPLDQQIGLQIHSDQEQPWEVRIGMVDALFAAGEIRRIARKLAIPLKD